MISQISRNVLSCAAALFLLFAPQARAHVLATTHLYGVYHYDDEIYAAGTSHRIFRGDLAGDWTLVGEGVTNRAWAGIAVGDGKIVAVGSGGEIGVSEDGETWQIEEEVFGDGIWQVVYLAESFWALGDEGRLYQSSDALQWDELETGSTNNLRGMAFDGNVFVIVGEKGTVLTSADGSDWTAQSLDASWDIRDIAVGTEGFVAIARGDAGLVLRSADGASWTSSSLTNRLLSAIAFGDGVYVISAGAGTRLAIFVSEDAENWIQADVPLSTTLPRLIFDGERFIAAGLYGSVLASTNGIDWRILRSEFEPSLWGVDEDSRGNVIVVGEAGQIRQRGEDGEWRTMGTRSSAWLWEVVSHGGISIAVGDDGRILRSDDGERWEVVRKHDIEDQLDLGAAEEDSFVPALRAVTYGMGKFVAVGGEGVLLTSEDGRDWKEGMLPVSAMFWSIAYGDGRFVAVGEGGVAAWSEDAESWESISFEEAESLYSVTFHEGIGFSMMGSGGFRAHSPDGMDWEVLAPEDDPTLTVTTRWERSASGTGWIVAVGHETISSTHQVLETRVITEISADGKNWERLDYAEEAELNGVMVGLRGATIVGSGGAVFEFPLPPLVRDQVADLTLSPGSEAFLWGEPGGTPPFEYSWTRDGGELSGEVGAEYTISNATRADIGDYRLELRNAAGEVQSRPIFLTVLTSFHEWREIHQAKLPEDYQSPDSDPFQTGIPNLLAYSFDRPPGTSREDLPAAGIRSVAFEGEGEEKFLTLTFFQAIGANDLVFIPEGSDDLQNWEPLSVNNFVSAEREGTRERVTVRDDVPIDGSGASRFLRLRVELSGQDSSVSE